MMDRQIDRPIPIPLVLCGVEGFENPLEMLRINAGSRIVHCDEDVLRLPFARC